MANHRCDRAGEPTKALISRALVVAHRRNDEESALGEVALKKDKTYSAKREALASRMLGLAMRGPGRMGWGSLLGYAKSRQYTGGGRSALRREGWSEVAAWERVPIRSGRGYDILHMYTSKGTGWNARKNVAPLLRVGAHCDSDPLRQSHTGALHHNHVS